MDVRQAGAQVVELLSGVKDLLKGGQILQQSKDALMQGKQILDSAGDSGWGADLPSHAMPFEVGDGSVVDALQRGDTGTAVLNSFATTAGLPSRAINGLHEISTQINYRAKVLSDATGRLWSGAWMTTIARP